VVETRDIDELIEAYGRIYAAPKFRVADKSPFATVITERQVGGVWVGYGRYDAATEREFPNAERFLYLLPINGATGTLRTRNHDCEIAPGRPVTISPAAGYCGHYSAMFESFSIMFDNTVLVRTLESMSGTPVDQPLVFEPQTDARSGRTGSLQAYLRMLIDTLERVGPSALPGWWIAQTEHMLAVLLLCEQRHNYSRLLDLPAADPSLEQVRRAEAYIEANKDRAIAAEGLVEASGVPVLSLYRAFKTVHGCSPMQFAQRLRNQKRRAW
jgi:hypothetical protein